MRKILTVIPIRSGSTGVKNKNIRMLGDKPLVGHVIEAAKNSPSVGKLVVSTDSENYVSVVNEYGAETPFIRPSELSGSTVRLHFVLKHALEYFDKQGEHFDAVLSLQATVPLIQSKTIDKLIKTFHETGCRSVGTLSMVRHGHPYLCKELNDDATVDFVKLDEKIPRYPRQVRPDLYYFNGSMFLRDRSLIDDIDETTNALGDKPLGIKMDDEEAINIDEEIDFKLAEFLYNKNHV